MGNEDDLRDPDMTTVSIGTGSSAVLDDAAEKFPYPTLEPGFDLLSDDWFQQQQQQLNQTDKQMTPATTAADNSDQQMRASSDKFMLYYPGSSAGIKTPFLYPKFEIAVEASIVKK